MSDLIELKIFLSSLLKPIVQEAIQNELEKKRIQFLSEESNQDQWFDIDELRDYLPGNPARSTIYANISNVPHKKVGKRLVFLRSEIDAWLMSQGKKTISDIEAEAEDAIVK